MRMAPTRLRAPFASWRHAGAVHQDIHRPDGSFDGAGAPVETFLVANIGNPCLKFIPDRGDGSDDLSVVSFHRRCVVIARARQAHQTDPLATETPWGR